MPAVQSLNWSPQNLLIGSYAQESALRMAPQVVKLLFGEEDELWLSGTASPWHEDGTRFSPWQCPLNRSSSNGLKDLHLESWKATPSLSRQVHTKQYYQPTFGRCKVLSKDSRMMLTLWAFQDKRCLEVVAVTCLQPTFYLSQKLRRTEKITKQYGMKPEPFI